MKFEYLRIQNFKSIRDMEITDIDNVLILIGKNSTGKTVVLDAIYALTGNYEIKKEHFNKDEKNISIEARLRFEADDYPLLHRQGLVSRYKRYDLWEKDFHAKLPSLKDDVLHFEMIVNKNGQVRYSDGYKKNNTYIRQALPAIYHIDTQRNLGQIQNDIILSQDDVWVNKLRNDKCMFDSAKNCTRCFRCIGVIEKKNAADLNVFETARLFEHKLYHRNLSTFLETVNEYFHKNSGKEDKIQVSMNFNPKEICQVESFVYNKERDMTTDLSLMSTGMRCIYILSLLEAYIQQSNRLPCIILMEDPEIFLHPQLQKVAGEILYRLSKKNQVIFSTHSPSMLFNFTSKQIRQVDLDANGYSIIKSDTRIDKILNDLGYTANDLMNVNFVFIVEGKQDKTRLPLLLHKYYSEVFDRKGKPFRIAIVTTNSCTNIKTYANLKYINQLYLKDQFLMIRDGDGKDPQELKNQLCHYYEQCSKHDIDTLPKVLPKNVLILKYYSFENYFLNPSVMTKIGIIKSEEVFYQTLFTKWNEYLHRLKSGKKLVQKTGFSPTCPEDIKENMELIKIHMRGHNLFDIFYGPHRKREKELLTQYIELAPREDFKDILDSIDRFIYFENRKREQ